jgi:hypothetical protein
MRLLPGCMIICAACLVFCGGCALVDEKVPLTYAPVQPKTQLAAGAPRRAGGTFEIARPAEPSVKKNKDGRSVIGAVRNSYGVHTASVVTDDSLANWFADSYRQELAAAGYDARVVDRLSPGCPQGIELEIRRADVDQDPGFWSVGSIAKLDYRMTLTQRGRPVQQIDWTATGSGDRDAFAGLGGKASAMRKAMQASLKQAVAYVDAALQR